MEDRSFAKFEETLKQLQTSTWEEVEKEQVSGVLESLALGDRHSAKMIEGKRAKRRGGGKQQMISESGGAGDATQKASAAAAH